MKIIAMVFVLFLAQLFTSLTFAQGEAAVPFLEIPTNSEMNGMGYASVAHITDNPAALTTNPAHLGMQCLDNSFFTVSRNYSDWMPTYDVDTWTRTYAVNAGVNLNKFYPSLPSLSVGISYANIYMNYGKYYRTGPDSPDPISSFQSYDQSNQVTISAAIDYYVRASLGFTYKHINSDLGNQPTAQEQGSGTATANLFDFGFLVDAPLVPLVSKIVNQPIPVYGNFSPICNFSLGISESNFGQNSISYIDKSQSDPLPRYARAGIELNLGAKYVKDNVSWVPISFKWTIEANDLLVKSDTSGKSTYQSGLGDINFFREVILGKTNKETVKLKGWELNLGETIYIYGGRFIEDYDRGNRNFTSDGYAISLTGLLKTLSIIQPGMFENQFMHYVLNHVGLKYNQSTVNTIDKTSPLNNTQFYSLNISFNNWL